MRRTYTLACRETLRVGQGLPLTIAQVSEYEQDGRHLYRTEEDLQLLRDFVFAHEATHESHELSFFNDQYLPFNSDDAPLWHSWDRAIFDECGCKRCQQEWPAKIRARHRP